MCWARGTYICPTLCIARSELTYTLVEAAFSRNASRDDPTFKTIVRILATFPSEVKVALAKALIASANYAEDESKCNTIRR